MMANQMEFSFSMFLILLLSFLGIAYSLGILLHSAFMYEDKPNMKKDSKSGWVLCMVAGTGIAGWLFYYGYFVNFLR